LVDSRFYFFWIWSTTTHGIDNLLQRSMVLLHSTRTFQSGTLWQGQCIEVRPLRLFFSVVPFAFFNWILVTLTPLLSLFPFHQYFTTVASNERCVAVLGCRRIMTKTHLRIVDPVLPGTVVATWAVTWHNPN